MNEPPHSARAPISARHVVAVCIGNGLEFYDFLAYALFAVYIGKAFFPFRSGSLSLLLSLATFGIGFLTRPIGAIVLGRFGDRAGRRPAMLISFLLMGTGMLGVAVMPTYARIGIIAPILVVVFRLAQGFALGGEVGPSTAYMIEAAPAQRRGLYGSLQLATQHASNLTAALVGITLTSLLSPRSLQDWGWRVAFLLGVSIVPFGALLRHQLPETLRPTHQGAPAGPLEIRVGVAGPEARPLLPTVALALVLLASGTIGTYVILYMTTYALTTLHMPANLAFGVTVVSASCQIIWLPLSGLLSDLFGRKPIILSGYTLLLACVLPAFRLIDSHPSTPLLYAAVGVLATSLAVASAPVLVALTETLPRAMRSGVVAITYAVAISIFGGSTQFVITWLIQHTGNPSAPAWYWMGALALGFTAAAFMPESAPVSSRAER